MPGRPKRETYFARNVASIKHEFKLLLGSLDPFSALNYLHYEGMVSESEKEEVDRHVASSSDRSSDGGMRPATVFKPGSWKTSRRAKQQAREKLTEIVDQKEDHEKLRAMVTALTTFKKLHHKVQHRYTVPELPEVTFEGDSKSEVTSQDSKQSLPLSKEQEVLAAFEQGTLSPEELIDLLKESKHKCNTAELTNFEGKTVLHLACCMQPVEVVETLVSEYHCSPNTQDCDGNTPLHEASRCRKPIVAKYLVNLPTCNPNIVNKNGETPLHLALSKEHWRLSKEILRSCRIDRSIKNAYGQTVEALIEGHPNSGERSKMNKLLDKTTSLFINPLIEQDSIEDKLDEDLVTPKESQVKPKGILRPFNPGSIRQTEINIGDSTSEDTSLVTKDGLPKVNSISGIERCCKISPLLLKLGCFFFTVSLVLAGLIVFIYFLVSQN